ncbi:hypothetical protein GA0070624_1992 [Micromonospora rhizosphaerae]|uniref:Uncharacterized protein n=1 Tax=Micromonospora rhizosphaerae TaxID=568872 RepID=A0A1C6RT95_9ACTN|nr:hypothetical protein GA0070624_1992 [Micromonospora rhizosphaerae]
MPSKTPRIFQPDLARSQVIWLTVGLADLVLIAVFASSNLRNIYDSQKDFLFGTLFSVGGFCFGRAFSRMQEQRALEMIAAPTEAVDRVLRRKMEERLHEEGAFRTLSVLDRDIEAAVGRLSEYYDSQARRLQFYRHAPLLRVALDDLDKAAANVATLRAILGGGRQARPEESIPVSIRLDLMRTRRDLREAIGRRDQAYEWLADRMGPEAHEAWDLFAVMTADMLKGDRMLEALGGQRIAYPVPEYLRTVHGYLAAALLRAEEFERTLAQHDIAKPTIYNVMVADLSSACTILRELVPKVVA